MFRLRCLSRHPKRGLEDPEVNKAISVSLSPPEPELKVTIRRKICKPDLESASKTLMANYVGISSADKDQRVSGKDRQPVEDDPGYPVATYARRPRMFGKSRSCAGPPLALVCCRVGGPTKLKSRARDSLWQGARRHDLTCT